MSANGGMEVLALGLAILSPIGINVSGNAKSGLNSPDKSGIKEETERLPLKY